MDNSPGNHTVNWNRVVKAAAVFILGIFLGKPAIEAVDGAVTVYQHDHAPVTQPSD